MSVWAPLGWVRALLTSPDHLPVLGGLLFAFEVAFNIVIIRYVPYTEIDWKAYMQQVKGYLAGERRYSRLEGATGPLVYPAGFLRLYSVFYQLSDYGRDIRRAQYIFAAIYLATILLVFAIYHRARRIPPWALLLVIRSKRMHSIYVLRLFNDGVAMLFLYASVLALTFDLWSSATMLMSLALSVKMNILLFVPAYALLVLQRLGLYALLSQAASGLALQLLIGAPFLTTHPSEYLSRSFDFGRAFLYRWTVNWRLVSEETFLSSTFALALLAGHLVTLVVFADRKWCRADGGLVRTVKRAFQNPGRPASMAASTATADDAVMMLFTCNLIGIIFARSLHYQFYSWYAHQLVLLVWRTQYNLFIRIFILFAIEYAFNIFPATAISSSVLLFSNCLLLLGIYLHRAAPPPSTPAPPRTGIHQNGHGKVTRKPR